MLLPYEPACGKCALRRWDPDAWSHPEDEPFAVTGRTTCPRFPVHIPHAIFFAEEVHPCFVPIQDEAPYIEPALLRILEKGTGVIPLIVPVSHD